MKWYYKWRLNTVRAEIAKLKKATETRLKDDYTGHSRLRVLFCMERGLQKKLDHYPSDAASRKTEAAAELKQTL